VRPRDRALERTFLTEACRGQWFDPEPLITHAQNRADLWGETVRVGPDWLFEALEEAPDFCNYLVWDLEENFVGEGREELLAAISEVASAYERVRRVREHRKEGL
jgi:hypothetical protein